MQISDMTKYETALIQQKLNNSDDPIMDLTSIVHEVIPNLKQFSIDHPEQHSDLIQDMVDAFKL